ncbi:hypothetical protein [Priestia megaterium]|uniref:hypothetical protein n=1 Tax=Priestia megaterium TaxID=1404 RepID=UPI002E1F8B28|nr:hypothetical protein [Priestia megaterium]
MKLFKLNVNTNEIFKLNVSNYEHQTNKQEPYFNESNNEIKHFAVCPACNNPIIIVNLYVKKTKDEKNNKSLHGRHYKNSIKGLANYNEENYKSCPFSNPQSFSKVEKRINIEKRNEILSLIKVYPHILYNFIRDITKVNFSENKFAELVGNFMKLEGYYYIYINKFNLPYSFLNMQKSINLYSQILYPNTEIIKSINDSKYFKVSNYNMIEKKVTDFATIGLYLANHRLNSSSDEFIDVVIYEKASKDKKENIIYQKTIEINHTKFISFINKEAKLRSIVNRYIKKE